MPVDAHRSCVVFEPPVGCVKQGKDDVLHRFSRMHVGPLDHERLEIEGRSVSFQHPVGDEHQPVAGLQRQLLHPILMTGIQPEGRLGDQLDRLDPAIA
jgi:hypothetical protein